MRSAISGNWKSFFSRLLESAQNIAFWLWMSKSSSEAAPIENVIRFTWFPLTNKIKNVKGAVFFLFCSDQSISTGSLKKNYDLIIIIIFGVWLRRGPVKVNNLEVFTPVMFKVLIAAAKELSSSYSSFTFARGSQWDDGFYQLTVKILPIIRLTVNQFFWVYFLYDLQ